MLIYLKKILVGKVNIRVVEGSEKATRGRGSDTQVRPEIKDTNWPGTLLYERDNQEKETRGPRLLEAEPR
jgi:hypothetical protein